METIQKATAKTETTAQKSAIPSDCKSFKEVEKRVREYPSFLPFPPAGSPPGIDTFDKYWGKYLNAIWYEPREGIECSLCKNKELIITMECGEQIHHKCSCIEKRDALARLRELGFAEQTKRYTFENYQTPQPWHKTAKEMVLQFVENPDREWLLLAGQSGAGKTHLAVAAASALFRQGLSLHYMRWAQSAPQLKANVNDSTVYQEMLQPMRQCDVLYIDDLWKCKGQAEPSDADVRLAFDILDYRYNNSGQITIISTEWTREELIRIDEAVGGRILEKTRGSQIVLVGKEKNWRLYGGK